MQLDILHLFYFLFTRCKLILKKKPFGRINQMYIVYIVVRELHKEAWNKLPLFLYIKLHNFGIHIYRVWQNIGK